MSEYFPNCIGQRQTQKYFRAYFVQFHPKLNAALPFRAPNSTILLNKVFGTNIPFKSHYTVAIDQIMRKVSGLEPEAFNQFLVNNPLDFSLLEKWIYMQKAEMYEKQAQLMANNNK